MATTRLSRFLGPLGVLALAIVSGLVLLPIIESAAPYGLTKSPAVDAVAAAPFYSQDFSMALGLPVLTLRTGSSGTLWVGFTSNYGFSGSITLAAAVSPSNGLTVDCISPVFTPTNSTSASMCTFSSSTVGNYTATITGASGSLSHSLTLDVKVLPSNAPDFSISSIPSSVTVEVGSLITSSIILTPVNGFTGTIYLNSWAPTGTLANPRCITEPIGPERSGTCTLQITAWSNTNAGTYNIIVGGTSGFFSHTTNVSVVVTGRSTSSTEQASNILGLDPPVFYTLIGVLSGALVSGIVVVRWRKSSRATRPLGDSNMSKSVSS